MKYLRLNTAAVLDFPLTGVQLIEASAGTGKTYTIANLYLRHILNGQEVAQILVVTFTVAATDELRGRIRRRLFEALESLEREKDSKDDFLRELLARVRRDDRTDLVIRRLRLAVRSMDQAAVYTIHSFCQRALTEFAFHSGQQFQMEVLTDDAALWRQAVEDWWRRNAYPLDSAALRLLTDSVGDLAAFRKLLEPLLQAQPRRLLPGATTPAEVFRGFAAFGDAVSDLARNWRQERARLTGILVASPGLSRASGRPYHPLALEASLEAVDQWLSGDGPQPPLKDFRVLTRDCIAANRLRRDDPELGDPFFDACASLATTLQNLQRQLRVAVLGDAARFARQQVRESKQAAQLLSFDDLLTEMRNALQTDRDGALAAAVRQQFPVAMIDEFQDTDPVQYGIFRSLYAGRPECGLIMIGDPKQAIYSFRGGDIFTYMQAKADVGADSLYTLDTNWRSTPELVNAVNQVFRNRPEDAFLYAEAIPFLPVKAADREHRHVTEDGARRAAMTVWMLPLQQAGNGDLKPPSKDRARSLCHEAVADEIARLIQGGRQGRIRLGNAPLQPRDMAVLVRTSQEGIGLRAALARRGVAAVSVSREGVFESAEAAALETLLQAILDPRERQLGRLALASPLHGLDYQAIEARFSSEEEWVAWVDRLLELRGIWQRQGFMPMFQKLLQATGVAEAVSRGQMAERGLTNLLHLGELLQQASREHGGMDALLSWYRQQRKAASARENELRLESDEELVQIVTIHASKGLEYPVVFVPYLWNCRPRNRDGLLPLHLDGIACMDAGSEDLEKHLRLAEQERLAEDLRLAYVALTRAESALYLIWGAAGKATAGAAQTAMGYLLHPHQNPESLNAQLPMAFVAGTDLRAELQPLADRAGDDLRVTALPEVAEMALLPPESAPPPLASARFQGAIADDWRVNSFSALTRNLHAGASAPRDGGQDDPGLGFPAGSHVGSYLHLLMEKLDFQGSIHSDVLEHSRRIAGRFNLDHGRWGENAARLVARVVVTPLNSEGLSLARISNEQRLNELQFDFSTGPVDVEALDRLLAAAAGQSLPRLETEAFRGMVTGVIDLVFEHEGRYFVADYKSNFLGNRFEDYQAAELRAAIHQRRYDLQYLLYTLALHRYLGLRLPGYDYARHFGGVYYLFMRAMRPETGAQAGVFFDRPAPGLIEELDRRIFAARLAGAA